MRRSTPRHLALLLASLVLGLASPPSAAQECNDSLDNDGDGQTDLADSDCMDAADPFEGVGVLSGQKLSDSAGDLSGPGNPGGLLADGDRFGNSVARIGDFDGDGVPDLAVTALGDDDGTPDAGAVYLLLLDPDGTVKARHKISDTAGGFSGPGNPGGVIDGPDALGSALAGLGDVDGDGVPDLALGSYLDDDGGGQRGAVYVVFMNADATVREFHKISHTSGDLSPYGLANSDRFGFGLAGIGDLDGDQVPDLATCASLDDDGGTNRGACYLLRLRRNGTVKVAQKISDTQGGFTGGLENEARFGAGLASLGDLDGDGVRDLAVGEVFDDGASADPNANRGAVWILLLRANGTVKDQVKIGDGTGGFPGGLLPDDTHFGESLTSLGDLDGDGHPEIAVGAHGDDAVWIVFLDGDGTAKSSPAPLRLADGAGGIPASLIVAGDDFGHSVASPGDVDGDGRSDLVIGWMREDDGVSGIDHGAAYVAFLDGASAVCGNGALDPGEECDDGGNVSGDLCSASCETETWLDLDGTATGAGSVEVTVDGNLVVQGVSPGETAAQVAASLATAIEATDPGLEAVADGDVLYTTGSITDVTVSVPGLFEHFADLVPYNAFLSVGVSRQPSARLRLFGNGGLLGAAATPQGRLRTLVPSAAASVTGTDRTAVASGALESIALTAAALLSNASFAGLSGPPGGYVVPVVGNLRFCFLTSCGGGGIAVNAPMSAVGFTTTFSTMSPNAVFAHEPWTISKATLTSTPSGPVTAAGFLHGPASNSVTAGLPGGVLQLVAPTQITSSVIGGETAMFTKLTIMLPEPSHFALLGAGSALLAALGCARLGRRHRGGTPHPAAATRRRTSP